MLTSLIGYRLQFFKLAWCYRLVSPRAVITIIVLTSSPLVSDHAWSSTRLDGFWDLYSQFPDQPAYAIATVFGLAETHSENRESLSFRSDWLPAAMKRCLHLLKSPRFVLAASPRQPWNSCNLELLRKVCSRIPGSLKRALSWSCLVGIDPLVSVVLNFRHFS
jgi:hypothetical protein